MKYTTSIVAILSVALFAYDCAAEPPGRQRGEKGKNAAGQRGGPGQRPGAGAERDPAQMVARMMQEFDKDGDSKLDARELTAMFTAMRERREKGGQPGGAAGQRQRDGQKRQGSGINGQKPGADGKRRQAGEKAARPGGDKPRRPPVEE